MLSLSSTINRFLRVIGFMSRVRRFSNEVIVFLDRDLVNVTIVVINAQLVDKLKYIRK